MNGNQIALIRGINVGRAKRVAMADLRLLFESLGYRRVQTLLNSGNVILEGSGKARDEASRVEHALLERLGISDRVTLFTAAELAAAVAGNPLREIAEDPSRLLVGFLKEAGDCKRFAPLIDKDPGISGPGPASRLFLVPRRRSCEPANEVRRPGGGRRHDHAQLGNGDEAARAR